MTPENRITAVVQRQLLQRGCAQLPGPEDDLRTTGLTSMDMLNLVLSIEAEFDLTIPESDISPANFRSIASIGRLVAALAPGR